MAASAAARRVNVPSARVAPPARAPRPSRPARPSRRARPAAARSAVAARRRAQAPRRPRAAAARRRGITPTAGLMIPVAVGARTVTAVGGLADSGLMLRLTRGRLWILLIGTLLVGIVALNVLSLSFSASASRTASQADTLEREISAMRAKLATAVSSGEVEHRAQQYGLIVPEPGSLRYIEPSADDAAIAAERIREGELSAP